MSLKLTGTERSWVLYDVGNSAFTLMLSTIIPIYFNSIAGEELSSVDYLAYWGYAASIATVLCAVLGPFLGAVSDRRGMKIRMFSCVLAVGVIGCAALGFVNEWLVFLIVLVITRLGYSLSLVFYDSMLVDVSSLQSMHNVSALGYAWGYIGSCIPFVVCLVLILGCESFGITMGTAMNRLTTSREGSPPSTRSGYWRRRSGTPDPRRRRSCSSSRSSSSSMAFTR